jgi:hypothetical protein
MGPEVIPFERTAQGARDESSQLDRAGETILQLLGKAADAAERNSRQAIDAAQRLSHQLRAAEDRMRSSRQRSRSRKSPARRAVAAYDLHRD